MACLSSDFGPLNQFRSSSYPPLLSELVAELHSKPEFRCCVTARLMTRPFLAPWGKYFDESSLAYIYDVAKDHLEECAELRDEIQKFCLAILTSTASHGSLGLSLEELSLVGEALAVFDIEDSYELVHTAMKALSLPQLHEILVMLGSAFSYTRLLELAAFSPVFKARCCKSIRKLQSATKDDCLTSFIAHLAGGFYGSEVFAIAKGMTFYATYTEMASINQHLSTATWSQRHNSIVSKLKKVEIKLLLHEASYRAAVDVIKLVKGNYLSSQELGYKVKQIARSNNCKLETELKRLVEVIQGLEGIYPSEAAQINAVLEGYQAILQKLNPPTISLSDSSSELALHLAALASIRAKVAVFLAQHRSVTTDVSQFCTVNCNLMRVRSEGSLYTYEICKKLQSFNPYYSVSSPDTCALYYLFAEATVSRTLMQLFAVDLRKDLAVRLTAEFSTIKSQTSFAYFEGCIYSIGWLISYDQPECDRLVVEEDRWESLPDPQVNSLGTLTVLKPIRRLFAIEIKDAQHFIVQELHLDELVWRTFTPRFPASSPSFDNFWISSPQSTKLFFIRNRVVYAVDPLQDAEATLQVGEVCLNYVWVCLVSGGYLYTHRDDTPVYADKLEIY